MSLEETGATELTQRLIVADVHRQLPGASRFEADEIAEEDIPTLVSHASLLSLSSESSDKAMAYDIVTRLLELFESSMPGLVAVADTIMSRLGNFPGRQLLRDRYASTQEALRAPRLLALERLAREFENTVPEYGSPLTDFQYDLFAKLDSFPSVSVSAPTSAGKSFVLGLDLVRRLRKGRPACVVYVVPTRALIREVTLSIRSHLSRAKLAGVPVRSVPFPIAKELAPMGAVFVLTQERLMTLILSEPQQQWISALIVDEAQSIREGARGVILQGAIESVLARFPRAEVHFASPLAKNPEFLLDLVNRTSRGEPLRETLSPVSQNLILVSEVPRHKRQAQFELVQGEANVDLGVRDLDFEFRGAKLKQRAAIARAVTRADDITLIYADEPDDAEQLARELIKDQEQPESVDSEIQELIEFVRADIHHDYPLVNCLPHGVAYHYGVMPGIVRARIEDLCKAGKIQYVCCTSTLLQGVNLPARNIVIENPKRGQGNPMKRRDFLNLAGRAGRLLREFHGNVWCLRPKTWEEKSFSGEPLHEIDSAMNEAMLDGGRLVQKAIRNELSGKEIDYGEAVFGKVYCDFVNGNRVLLESQWKTPENATALAETERQLRELVITLPPGLIDANRTVRPDRLQDLYNHLHAQTDLDLFFPLPPSARGSNNRMELIIQLVQEKLGGVDDGSYRFYKMLASKWVHGTALSAIIGEHISYRKEQGDDRNIAVLIRELLKALDKHIRFRLVKFFMAYASILDFELRQRGDNVRADSIEPFHVYLECGASDRIALNLIALGLSRATALALRNKIKFADDATPEQCLEELGRRNLDALSIPKLCVREVEDLIGRELIAAQYQ
ncbi:MAG TPA: DEAD/DEAH box helicase [Polyangiaceae bacterium]